MKASFIEPMLLERTARLPEGGLWRYEVKWDGYRAIAYKTGGKLHLRSRNDNDFSVRYAGVTEALAKLPEDTVVDGEIVALDERGRPSFNILQNYGSARAPVHYYVFDVLMLKGKDVMREPLSVRQEILATKILPKLADPVRGAGSLDAPLSVLIASVKQQGLEGLVAKRLDRRTSRGNARARGRRCASTKGKSSSSAGTRSADAPSTRSSLGTTTGKNSSSPQKRGTASRQHSGRSSCASSPVSKSKSAPLLACRKSARAGGGKDSPQKKCRTAGGSSPSSSRSLSSSSGPPTTTCGIQASSRCEPTRRPKR